MTAEPKRRMRTDYIAVHCSATPPSLDIGEETIRQWHVQKGWSDIGYNVVIKRDGTIQIGRPIDSIGAHVAGFNSVSLGICVIGGVDQSGRPDANFTPQQWTSLRVALRFFKHMYPGAKIQGHRDFPNVDKACPSFDVRAWLLDSAADLL